MLHLPGGFPPISNRGVASDSVPCGQCKEIYDPAFARETVRTQLPAPYAPVYCPQCQQVNRATGALIGLERPYVHCCGAPGCIVDRAAAILDGGWFCPDHAPTPDPEPLDHAAREAAQHADEAEMLVVDSLPQIPTYSDHPNGIVGAILEYLDPALYAEKFPEPPPAPTLAARIALARTGQTSAAVRWGEAWHRRYNVNEDQAAIQALAARGLPPMAGGSEDAQTITDFRTVWQNSVWVQLSCGHSVMLATEANLSIGQPWYCPEHHEMRHCR